MPRAVAVLAPHHLSQAFDDDAIRAALADSSGHAGKARKLLTENLKKEEL